MHRPPPPAAPQIRTKLVASHAEITEIMSVLYKFFAGDSEEVQREWVRFTQKIDLQLEAALRHTVKKSLQELAKALNGDSKGRRTAEDADVPPILRVTAVLERNNRVELRPTIQMLFDMIHKVSRELITVVQCVPRVALQLTERQKREIQVWQRMGL